MYWQPTLIIWALYLFIWGLQGVLKIDIVIADPLCEKGHIPTAKFFLNELKILMYAL